MAQVKPIKPALKAPGTKRLKLKYDELPSSFAFNFNLRRYSVGLEGPIISSVSFDVTAVGGEVLSKMFSCCPGSQFPQVYFYLAMTRFNVDYLRNIFVPVCLSVMVGFLAYFIPAAEGERLGLGVTCLLTVLAVMVRARFRVLRFRV